MYLQCASDAHQGQRPTYSLLDATGAAEAALADKRCPMCPAQAVATDPDAPWLCTCCGSTWMAAGTEVTCLPGLATRLVQQ